MDHSNTSVQSQVAVGTACAPCKAKGHWCPAYEIIDGRALCLYCVDGERCPKTPRDGVAPAVKVIVQPAAKGTVGGRKPGTPYKVAERERAKAMLLSGMSLKATAAASGLSKNTISRVRAEMPGLPRAGKGGVPKGAVAARRTRMDGVDVKVSVEENGTMGSKAKTVFAKLEEEHAVFPAPLADVTERVTSTGAPMSVPVGSQPGTMVQSAADGWEWVEMSAVPDYRTRSIYDDAVMRLRAAPVDKPMRRSLANADIADTFMKGITRRARDLGLKVGSRQDGSTIWVWRKA